MARIPLSPSLSLSFIHSWRGKGRAPFVDGRDRSHHEIVRLNLVGFRRARLPAEGLTELSKSIARRGEGGTRAFPLRASPRTFFILLSSDFIKPSSPDSPPVTDLKNRRLTLSRCWCTLAGTLTVNWRGATIPVMEYIAAHADLAFSFSR